MFQNLKTFLVGSILAIGLSSTANAAVHHGHCSSHNNEDKLFYGHAEVILHLDSITDAKDSDGEINETYMHSHFDFGFHLGRGFSINSTLKLDGHPHANGHGHEHGGEHADDDRFFDDHPLFIEQLTLNYDSDNYAAYIGKFNPNVTFDYHSFPGIYGYQIAEEYAIRERIGIGGAIKHNAGDYGNHRLDVSTFFADTTFLSDSVLRDRGHTSKEDGGIANTEDFSSLAVSLGGSDFYSLNNNFVEGLSYRASYVKQKEGVDGEEAEQRYSISLGYQEQINENLAVRVISEYVDIDHLGGEKKHDRAYTTTALRFDYKNWNLGTSYTDINNTVREDDHGHHHGDDHSGEDGDIFQISVGYTFDMGLGLDLGYQKSDQEAEVTERLGASVRYSYEF